jgi:hypothetical protein
MANIFIYIILHDLINIPAIMADESAIHIKRNILIDKSFVDLVL